jgi:hypothetical protein
MDPSNGMRRPELFFLLLVAVVLVAVVYLTSPSMFSSTDFLRIHTFYKNYIKASIPAGHWLPLWNPYVNLGRPFLADPDSTMFYPPHLLYLVLEARWAWSILAMAHVWFGMVGVALWLRAIGSGTRVSLALAAAFMLTAPIVETFQNGLIHYAIGLTYLPWIFLFSLRLQASPSVKTVATLAFLVAMQYLGGHAQITWISAVGVALFLLVRRSALPLQRTLRLVILDLALLGGSFLWGFALAAVQILPTLELASNGNRHSSLAFAASFSLPFHAFFSLIWPVGPHYFLEETANLFCGTSILVAGVAGLLRMHHRNVRALLALAIFSVLLALGDRTPFFRLCYAWLPGCSMFRLHSRTMLLLTFALVSATGMMLSQTPKQKGFDLTFAIPAILVFFCLAMLAGILGPALRSRQIQGSGFTHLGVGFLSIASLWLWQNRKQWTGIFSTFLAPLLLTLTVAVDLSLSFTGIKQIREQRSSEPTEKALNHLLASHHLFIPDGPPPRVSFPMPVSRENAGMSFGWSSFSGYVTLTLDRVFAFMYGMRGLKEPLNNTFPASNVYAGPFPFSSMSLQAGFDPLQKKVFLNPNPDPRLYLVNHHLVVDDWRQALLLMKRGHDFHHTVLLEKALDLPMGRQAFTRPPESPDLNLPTRSQIIKFEPERIQIETESPIAAWLVLAEAWYPGWTATVDGQSVPCLPSNVWMRAIPVPAGLHKIVLVYQSNYLRLGALLTFLSLLAVVLVLRFSRVPRYGSVESNNQEIANEASLTVR